MRPSAAIAETAVISPRGHDSACPRQMIQARISGARAPASRNQRAIVWTSQPVNVSCLLAGTPLIALSRSILYQVRKSPTASRTPPTIAMISERDSPDSFMWPDPTGNRGLGLDARDGHRDRGAGVAR